MWCVCVSRRKKSQANCTRYIHKTETPNDSFGWFIFLLFFFVALFFAAHSVSKATDGPNILNSVCISYFLYGFTALCFRFHTTLVYTIAHVMWHRCACYNNSRLVSKINKLIIIIIIVLMFIKKVKLLSCSLARSHPFKYSINWKSKSNFLIELLLIKLMKSIFQMKCDADRPWQLKHTHSHTHTPLQLNLKIWNSCVLSTLIEYYAMVQYDVPYLL